MKPNRVLILVLSSALSFSGVAWAHGVPSQPVKHKIKSQHPNLDAAKRALQEAAAAVLAAEKASEFDSQEDAQKAKNLIGEATQQLEKAATKVAAAENANEFDPDGHAQKAKDLINQAYQELKSATEPAAKK
jgi:hypothetical protein